jgi:quercetin dioxygenase-like cupin family protein
MAAIIFRSPDDTPLIHTADVADDAMRAKLSEGEIGTSTRFYHPGSDTDLQMFEVTVKPGDLIDQHAHDEDEIIYVLEGEMRLGSRVVGPGGSAHIPGRTLYSFRAGSEGLRFLNFRARADMTYISKEELMAQRNTP